MARTSGTLSLGSNLEPKMSAPLDAREVVNSKSDLLDAASFPYFYEGMKVYVKSEKKLYILVGNDTTVEENWLEAGSGTGQTIQVEVLPAASSDLDGTIYQYVGATTAIATNGYFYKCVEDSENAGSYKWVNEKVQDSEPNVIEHIELNGTEITPDATRTVNIEAIPASEKGSAEGVAELDTTGKVPSSQLPSYVDDVINGYLNDADGKFYEEDTYTTEIEGETGKIYIDLSTEKTFRWSGIVFVEISESLALGETSSTAYAGNKGKQNADDIADLKTEKQDVIQYSTMPTVTADDAGKIVQYTGATTADYTSGYFYECIEDPDSAGNYIWTAKNVQDGGGSGALGKDITASIEVGGIDAGTTFNEGTSYDEMFDALLNPTLYPALTAPSASISGSGAKLLEVGATLSATITVDFNRGRINPAYGTSGYRAGAATGYILNGGTEQTGNTFSETVSGTNNTFQATVNYAAGEQPKDSKGGNYDSPLAAGSIATGTLTYEFVNALYANTSNAATISKQSLVSKSAKVKAFSFPATTAENPEVFDVPASWTVTAVEVLNTLSNQWETATAQFTVTDTTHDDAAGTSTAYKRYSCNLGYALGARSVRVKWS